MPPKSEANRVKRGTVRLIPKKQALQDPFPDRRVTLHTLTETIMSYHYQRRFAPLYAYVVYSGQLKNLSKEYTLEQLKTAVEKAAVNAKASWGMNSIKQFLPQVVITEPTDYLIELTAGWSIQS